MQYLPSTMTARFMRKRTDMKLHNFCFDKVTKLPCWEPVAGFNFTCLNYDYGLLKFSWQFFTICPDWLVENRKATNEVHPHIFSCIRKRSSSTYSLRNSIQKPIVLNSIYHSAGCSNLHNSISSQSVFRMNHAPRKLTTSLLILFL